MRTAVVDARTAVYQRNMRYASLERALQLFREARSRNVILSPDLCREFVLVRPRAQLCVVCPCHGTLLIYAILEPKRLSACCHAQAHVAGTCLWPCGQLHCTPSGT